MVQDMGHIGGRIGIVQLAADCLEGLVEGQARP